MHPNMWHSEARLGIDAVGQVREICFTLRIDPLSHGMTQYFIARMECKRHEHPRKQKFVHISGVGWEPSQFGRSAGGLIFVFDNIHAVNDSLFGWLLRTLLE